MAKYSEITKNIPLISLFLVLCSSISHVLYYKQFNVRIVEYIHLKEYLELFVDDALFYLLSFGLLIFVEIFKKKKIIYLNEVEYEKHIESKKKDRKFMIYSSILFLIVMSVMILTTKEHHKVAFLIGLTLFSLLNILETYSRNSKFELNFFLYLAIAILIFVISNSFIKSFKIKENVIDREYHFFVENKVIKTTDELRYLGRTERYFFLFEAVSQETIIYSTDNLEKVIIKSKSTK